MVAATRRVVIVSPHFPPSTLAGVHRARLLARHLPAVGWEPIILCVDERHHEERLDPSLAALLPRGLRVVKAGALPARWTRSVGFGDLGLRGYLQLRNALIAILGTEQIDCVFITAAPYYPTMLGAVVKRRFGIPIVLDYQDPWVSKWGATLPRWSKGGLSHRLATWLEPKAVAAADHIVSVSEGQNRELAERHPWFDAGRMSAIPIGCDPADYTYLCSHPLKCAEVLLEPDAVNLSFVGTAMPRSGPVIEALFSAVAALRRMRPELTRLVRLNFVGTSNQPNGRYDYRVRRSAESAGIADLVFETPQRVPYLEALNILASSHGILLLGSDEPHYTASKIYPAILSNRPALGIFHKASSAGRILRECGNSTLVEFSDLNDLRNRASEIAGKLEQLIERPNNFPPTNRLAIEPFTAEHLAGEFAAIFDTVCRRAQPRHE